MNKIFKKVWNKRRGCFVAVSEAMPAASQSSKTSVIVGSALLLSSMMTANAATINGNASWNDIAFSFHDNGSSMIRSDYVINGSLTVPYRGQTGWSFIAFDCSHGDTGRPVQSLTVRDNMTIDNQAILILAGHGSGRGGSNGTLAVGGDLNLNSSLYFGLDRGGETGSLQVNGVLRLGQSGTLADSLNGNTNPKISLNANVLDTSGTVDFKSGTGSVNFGKVIVRGGNYVESSAVPMTISQGLELLGGTFVNRNPIVVGQNVGSYLTLGGGHFSNAQTLGIKNNGKVSVTGGNYNFATLSKENGTLTNFGTLSVTNFNQSGGSTKNSGTLTIGNSNLGGTLENVARLTLTGNVTTRGNLTSTGTLTNNGNWTEANRYTITGNLHNTGSINFKNGFHIQNGFMTSSGTIQTNDAFNIFDSLGTTGQQDLHYVALGSTVPQDVKTSLTDFFQKYLPGTLAKSLVGHASFTAGKVIVSGVTLTQTQHDDLVKVFKDKFGGNTTLEFQGTIAGVSHDDKLTVAKTNELYDNVEHLRDVIFVDRKLEGENGAIVVGDSGLRNSTGFTGINEATGTTIQDGKELTLIGGKSDGTGNRFTLAERIISAIGDGAKLILGSLGIKDSSVYQGQAEQVQLSEKGELKVAAGDYLVKNLNSSGGKTTVDKNAVFNSENATFTDKAVLENNGETVLGTLTGWNGAEVHNNSKLTVNGITQFGGRFINKALAKVDSVLTEAGSIVSNATDAVLTIAGLNNASELQGTVNNDGTIKVEGTQSVTVADGELNNNGSMENTNALNVEGGLVNNKGNLALTGLNITGGQVSNDASAYFKDAGVTEIAMSDTGDVAIQNAGLLELTELQLTKGTISGGTVGVKETTIASVKADGVIDAASVGFKDLTNEGVITVSDMFASANTENSGTVEAANIAMSEGDKFVNEAGATAKADKLDISGGEFVNEAGDTSGIVLTQIGADGQFTANGDTTLQQVVSADGIINLNKGNLNIAELDAKDSVYNQKAGNFKADKGFFENSTLNIMGGVFDASEVRDAEGNVTGLLGNNVVNISGTNKTPIINNEDSAEDKAHYKDNLTQVLAGVVNSDTTVNIMEGGVLDVAKIELDGKADSINLKGGVLQTSADQIFGSVTTEAIRIDATDAETGTVQLPTTVLSATTVGAVKDEIKSGLNVESGNLALDDDYFSASLIVSVTDKIANAFENAANLTINFLGEMTAPFTITTANDLEKEGLDVVLNPGIVLNTTTLHNEFADEYNKDTDASQTIKGLIIGAESNDPNTNSINISMGFKDVSHTDKVTIEGGKELVLVGNAVNAIPEGSFGDDANKLLKDSADGGSIDVNNGTFTFGSHGGSTPTVGWILSSNIGENGSLEAKNGEFADWTIANNGNVHVHSNAILHTNSLTGNGAAVNEGKLSLDEKDGKGPTFDVAGSFTNKGENSILDASKVEKVTVSGTQVNEGKADYKDMLVAEGGSSTNSGTEQGNILTVEGSHANTGTSIWNGVTVADKGKGENAGKLDVGSVFDILGEFVNKGAEAVLDATKTAVTNVAGILRNEGTANYDDMTIADGGKSENAGFEKGDILTVATGAEHNNSGTSIWNNVTVQDGATSTVEEGAKETINDAYVVAGDRTNKGEVDATGVENTEVTGTLDNQGTSNYDDMTVEAGGKSDNSGYEKGDILTIADGGEHTNSGTSIWNNQTVKEGGTSVTEEGGKETINDKYVIEGDKTNRGEVDAKGVENTEVKGNLDNQGKSEYDDMTIGDGGKSDNSGYEKGDILTIDKGGEHDNSGTSIWNNVVVAGGDVNNTGDIETEKLTIDDGLVNIGEGSLNAGETDLNGGDLVIGNDKDRTPENRVTAEINPKNDVIDTNIYVKNNGDLNLGPKGGLDWADSIGSPTVPSGTPSRLVITTNVTTGPGGGIAVGPEVWTDKDNHVQIGNGDLYFAKDSLTVIDSSILTDGKSAFNTTSNVAKVTVEPGANLVLGNIEEVGDYTIVNDYITGGNESDGMWTGGWTGDNLYALPQDGSGINWILKLHNDPSKIWVNATLADVRTVYPDIAIPNIANDDMLNCKSGDPGADFVCRVLRDKELDVAGKTKILNSVANIAFAGGAMSVAMNDLNSATDSIEGRVSMKNEAFTEYGVMREWERGNDLWIDVIGGKQKYKSLSATGISKAGYDTNSYGFVMGYDRKFADKPIILGAAFSYNHGSLDSTGDVLKTKNKYNSFGLHAYGAYAPVEKVNLIGTLSWMHNSSDITQSINAAGFNKADADVKTNMFSLGARAEATIPAGTANIVPHAGLRYVWAKSGKYDTKVDGKKVWSNKADATNTFQLPIGVAVRTDIATASGWNVRPQADVTVIPQFGDTKQKTKLSNFNGVSDKLSGEFAGKFGTNVNLGVQADKGPATIGVRYGFTGGTKGKADHMFKLEARYRF